MVKKYYRKPHRYKRKKPIFRKRFFWLGILALIIFAALFYSLIFLKNFQVEKIIVSGEEKVAKQELELLVEQRLENRILFFKTKSIFALNLGQMRHDILNSFPQIAGVEISRDFFDAVNIVVTERQGVARWCGGEKCFLLDNEGVIFEEAAETETSLVLIRTAKPSLTELGEIVIEKTFLSQIFEIKSRLAADVKIAITEAALVSEERLNMKTSEGWKIYFNLEGDLDWQLTELALVLEKQISPQKRGELEYIDLRFSRVYYKYQP